MELITSPSNALVKQIVKLDKNRERERSGLFVVEGIREITLAAASGIELEHLMLNERWAEPAIQTFVEQTKPNRVVMFSNELFAKVSYRQSVANALAICRWSVPSIDKLKVDAPGLVLVLESVEKPGNLGAIFRTADAAGIDAIIVANPVANIFNTNTIRASLGSLFTVPFASGTNEEVLDWLQTHQYQIWASSLEAYIPHFEANFKGDTAILMGSEARGISTFWEKAAHQMIKIPMRGHVDSMNVSTAAAVLIYEAIRQRL